MTSTDWIPVIVAAISAIAAIIAVVRQTRKDKTDIANEIGEAWGKLIKPLEDRVTRLEKENELLRRRERILWDYIDSLRSLLEHSDLEMPPLPELPRMEDK